tara:strand:+ start:241 stop:876 length:636 start_codon:yes stop_codon:yes gene_type:complete
MIFKEEELGKNWKERFNFLIMVLFLKIKIKKRIKISKIKKLSMKVDNINLANENPLKDLKFNITNNFKTNELNWDKKQLKLKKVINNGGYKEGLNTFVTITKDNLILDGNHRVSLLKEKYGDDYKILVKKTLYSQKKLMKKCLEKLNEEERNPNLSTSPFMKNNIHKTLMDDNILNKLNLTEKIILEEVNIEMLINIWNNSFPKNKIEVDE